MAGKNTSDIARNTIFVLLILTILISAISTWVILDTINDVRSQYSGISSVQKGYINLNIVPKPGEAAEPQSEAANTKTVTAGVVLSIVDKPSQLL